MWFFNSPEIVFGEDALSYLAQLRGERAYIVTDPQMVSMGYVDLVVQQLAVANIGVRTFAEVEPEPCLDTVRRGAKLIAEFQPDWIIGLGGGSPMDAAKAMWVLYEHPDVAPEGINPLEYLGLGKKARLITIPTTSGTGSEATWAIVLSDTVAGRKLGLGSRETLATLAIVDPVFAMKMPPRLTADTGLDVLTHAIEGYASTWHNDFADGLCLKAVELTLQYLPLAYADGTDALAREKMHNAAAIAGLGFINSLTSLAHAMGHAFGGTFHVPHGRCVSLFLPYTMEFVRNGGLADRYADIARYVGLDGGSAEAKAGLLIQRIRELEGSLGSDTCVATLGISQVDYAAALDVLLNHTENDTSIVSAARVPTRAELAMLFEYAYAGRPVDF